MKLKLSLCAQGASCELFAAALGKETKKQTQAALPAVSRVVASMRLHWQWNELLSQ